MKVDLNGRQIKMFRTYRDPNIPPKARNAFMLGTGPDQLPGEAYMTDHGIFIKMKMLNWTQAREYFISYANIENIELVPEEASVTPITKGKRGETA